MIDVQELDAQLQYRQRLLDQLVAQDKKIRDLFTADQVDEAPSIERMPALIEVRDALNLTKDEYETRTKDIGTWMRGALTVAGVPKWESTSHIVQIMEPPPRVSFNEEVAKTELILTGVPIDKIVAAFDKARKVTPVASFIRVDKRRSKK